MTKIFQIILVVSVAYGQGQIQRANQKLEVIVDGPKKFEVMNDICHVAKPEVLSIVLNIILFFECYRL